MRNQVAVFRPTDRNKNRLDMAKTLRLNVSEMINEILEHHMDNEIKKRTARLQKEMERAKGFEPSTFTLARCSGGLRLTVRAGNMANVAGKVQGSGAVPDFIGHRVTKGNANDPPENREFRRPVRLH